MKIAVTTLVCALAAITSSVAFASDGGQGDHKTTLCHKTGSASNPWVLITIDNHAVDFPHLEHGDVYPRDGQCPATADGWPPDTGGSNPPPPPPDNGGGGML
jgi:hypothetical protein